MGCSLIMAQTDIQSAFDTYEETVHRLVETVGELQKDNDLSLFDIGGPPREMFGRPILEKPIFRVFEPNVPHLPKKLVVMPSSVGYKDSKKYLANWELYRNYFLERVIDFAEALPEEFSKWKKSWARGYQAPGSEYGDIWGRSIHFTERSYSPRIKPEVRFSHYPFLIAGEHLASLIRCLGIGWKFEERYFKLGNNGKNRDRAFWYSGDRELTESPREHFKKNFALVRRLPDEELEAAGNWINDPENIRKNPDLLGIIEDFENEQAKRWSVS